MTENLALAFAVTTGAGLATGIGAALGLFAKKTNYRFLALALGFSAGVMLYIAFVEIVPKGVALFETSSSELSAMIWAAGAFIAGLLAMALLYRFIPHFEALDEADAQPFGNATSASDGNTHRPLLGAGILIALAIAIHNFPEGIATFFITLEDPTLGGATAVSIAIHNIPEGIAVAVPLYFALGKRWLAFLGGLASGLAEPVGALLGYLVLQPFITDTLLGALFAVVAGIMVYISIDSLLPTAREYHRGQLAMYGVIAGMAVMAASLILFAAARA